MAAGGYFTAETFRFLKQLAKNNDRDWFAANKPRYEEHVKEPALRLIQDFAPHLAELSPHFHAGPRSLFRIHRDTRFAKDKSPYKTHTGIHFRHDTAKDAHAPGYYFHIQPGEVFLGMGLWHPDAPTLRKIRDHIVEKPAAWKKACKGKKFTGMFVQEGDRLSRVPRGYDPEHPMADELMWKDHFGLRQVDDDFVTSPHLPRELARAYAAGSEYMVFLCEAVGVPF
ncbi:MAG: TIGR02453 family protein [Gemmatimonadota bacterium]